MFKLLGIEQESALSEGPPAFVIKKHNKYMCINTSEFKIINMCNFLAPGTTYRDFLKAYNDNNIEKGYFCYDFLDSAEKLNFDRLPPYEAFYSDLKQGNILEEEYKEFSNYLNDGFSEAEALKMLDLKSVPLTGRAIYDELKVIWDREGMSTLRDYLIYYNNLDSFPFIGCIDKMFKYYNELGIDLFKTCVSVPGVTRELLYKSIEEKTHLSLFGEGDKDIHQIFQRNIVGGSSLVFRRHRAKNETYIRNGDRVCKTIQGLAGR